MLALRRMTDMIAPPVRYIATTKWPTTTMMSVYAPASVARKDSDGTGSAQPMADTVGAHILERLHGLGVRLVYGYPGDGINGSSARWIGSDSEVEFIQIRHEELAAFMACAHAKFTGEVGVCMATSGPGAIHLLNGLYDAKLDHQPVVAIVGQQARTALGSNYQQEVDLAVLFKDVA